LNVASITNSNLANVSSMNISNADITTAGWSYTNTAANHTLNAANSIINTNTFAATGLTYNKVNVAGTAGTHALLAGATIDSLVFTNPSTSSVVGINGANNSLNYVEYKGSGNVYGTGNTINTMIFFPGKIYTFTAGTTTNITNEWYASGTPCNLTEIVSSSTTANATINKTNGTPAFDYIRVRRITATGSIPFTALNHTIDQGNNNNWSIAPYNGAAPIYGLGPDTAIAASALPYVLHTDGFFGNPSSLYVWNNSSTADSLMVTDTGTYSVNVNFVDGCNISDSIHITLSVPLPVMLTSFTAVVRNCQAHLNWSVTDAVNFTRFVIEKSKDGIHFNGIGMVSYTKDVQAYTYVDKEQENGTCYYRLKLMDQDGKYQYSTIESTHSDCQGQLIKVYPTLTKGVVYIDLPSGYEQAQIEVYNALGQLLNLSKTGSVNQSGMHIVQLHGLALGQYLLKVIKGNEVNTFKIIYQP
jgi:trimeric autotransporter adhesin